MNIIDAGLPWALSWLHCDMPPVSRQSGVNLVTVTVTVTVIIIKFTKYCCFGLTLLYGMLYHTLTCYITPPWWNWAGFGPGSRRRRGGPGLADAGGSPGRAGGPSRPFPGQRARRSCKTNGSAAHGTPGDPPLHLRLDSDAGSESSAGPGGLI